MNDEKRNLSQIGSMLKAHAVLLGGFVAFIWILEGVDIFIFNNALDQYGIRPRSWIGLRGILFAPFLHDGFQHVMANSVPFLLLGWFVLMQGTWEFAVVTIMSTVFSGLGAWLFGAPHSVHIGVSGVIMGYFGYLLLRGYFERSFTAVLWSIFIIFLYGGLIWGVLPGQAGVSWQSHLFGFIGGGMAAYALKRME